MNSLYFFVDLKKRGIFVSPINPPESDSFFVQITGVLFLNI